MPNGSDVNSSMTKYYTLTRPWHCFEWKNIIALFGDRLVKHPDVTCWASESNIHIWKGDSRTFAPELSAFYARDLFNKLEEGDANFYSWIPYSTRDIRKRLSHSHPLYFIDFNVITAQMWDKCSYYAVKSKINEPEVTHHNFKLLIETVIL